MALLSNEFKAEMGVSSNEFKADMIKWGAGIVFSAIGATLAFIKLALN
ncbi:hypothetical protein [Pseudoalteromonas sp. TAE56]|jgi:hypothetical protein|nr:hypothetical protein [Pseudoalteromonas sp. TAE56]